MKIRKVEVSLGGALAPPIMIGAPIFRVARHHLPGASAAKGSWV